MVEFIIFEDSPIRVTRQILCGKLRACLSLYLDRLSLCKNAYATVSEGSSGTSCLVFQEPLIFSSEQAVGAFRYVIFLDDRGPTFYLDVGKEICLNPGEKFEVKFD